MVWTHWTFLWHVAWSIYICNGFTWQLAIRLPVIQWKMDRHLFCPCLGSRCGILTVYTGWLPASMPAEWNTCSSSPRMFIPIFVALSLTQDYSVYKLPLLPVEHTVILWLIASTFCHSYHKCWLVSTSLAYSCIWAACLPPSHRACCSAGYCCDKQIEHKSTSELDDTHCHGQHHHWIPNPSVHCRCKYE